MSHDLKKKTVFDVDGFILLSDDKILRGWKRTQKKVESLQNVREKLCCLLYEYFLKDGTSSVNNVTSSVESRSSYLKNRTLSVKNGTIIKNCVRQE